MNEALLKLLILDYWASHKNITLEEATKYIIEQYNIVEEFERDW